MPDVEYAFLADAAEAVPGQKFQVIGGGVSRLAGRAFPLRHPHLALVVTLRMSQAEHDQGHALRIVLLAPDQAEVASADGNVVAQGRGDGRDQLVTFAIDFWNLVLPLPGEYAVAISVDGTERKRLPLVVAPLLEAPTPGQTYLA